VHRKLLIPLLILVMIPIGRGALAARVDFTAVRGFDTATGYFEWSPDNPIYYSVADGFGNGKILWTISGAIALNGTPTPMTDVTLEVMNNWYIDAPIPNSLIGDQITLFGTASPTSGLYSVQNFYFRDETGTLLTEIRQPNSQADFDAFQSVRVDLMTNGGLQSFALTQWSVTSLVPIPAALWLFGGALGALGVLKRGA
jgi:hypothetical protein